MCGTFDEEGQHLAAHPGEAHLERVRCSQLGPVRGVVQGFDLVGQGVPEWEGGGHAQREWIDTIDVSGVEWQRDHGFRASPREVRHQRSPPGAWPARTHRYGPGRLREEKRYPGSPQASWRLWLVREEAAWRWLPEEVQAEVRGFPKAWLRPSVGPTAMASVFHYLAGFASVKKGALAFTLCYEIIFW